MKRVLFIVSAILLCMQASAYRLQEVAVKSECMNKDVPVNVITPDSYEDGLEFPVVYLLHGYSDNHQRWATGGHIGALADKHDVIVVMPDGAYSSWYFDSPVDPTFKYETFVSKELVEHVDANFKTRKDRKARAITGLSMGGHGAMYLALRHQDVFATVGSMSGGVDIRPFPNNWHLSKRLGTIEEHPENWEANTVINLTHLIQPDSLNIIFDCGVDDFFYEVNCNLHKKLLEAKIPHDFISRPGKHNWPYWFNSVRYQFLFFSDRFNEANNQ